ncbi:hypothetical protein AKJ16_DCAP19042 [Drosera capensis]
MIHFWQNFLFPCRRYQNSEHVNFSEEVGNEMEEIFSFISLQTSAADGLRLGKLWRQTAAREAMDVASSMSISAMILLSAIATTISTSRWLLFRTINASILCSLEENASSPVINSSMMIPRL